MRPAAREGVTAGSGGAGLLAWHWFDTEAPDGDRTQFLDEAVELAAAGVVSLLPQGRFPWPSAPIGGAADAAAVTAEVERLRLGLDLLASDPTVDAGSARARRARLRGDVRDGRRRGGDQACVPSS